MKQNVSRALNKAREWIVIIYEIFTLVSPLIFLYLTVKQSISSQSLVLGTFYFLIPALSHAGVFGDKLKSVTDKIIGYEK